MNVRCKKGHIWEVQNLNWEKFQEGKISKESDICCPECKEMPIDKVTVKEAETMGNKEEGRKLTKID